MPFIDFKLKFPNIQRINIKAYDETIQILKQ